MNDCGRRNETTQTEWSSLPSTLILILLNHYCVRKINYNNNQDDEIVGSYAKLFHSAVSQKSCHVSYFLNHFTLHGQWPAEELDFDSAPVTDNHLINCYFYNILHCHHHKIVHTNTIILSDFLANCCNFQNLVRSGS